MNPFDKFLTSLNLDPVACGAIGMDSKTTLGESSAKQIRRACDECSWFPHLERMTQLITDQTEGARKLACSKDPDGCERCKRENIVCHYSEQKPMGRPRKRQFIDTKEQTTENATQDLPQDLGLLPLFIDDAYNDAAIAEPYFTNGQPANYQPMDGPELQATKTDNGRGAWHFGDREIMAGPPINFGDIDFNSGENIPSLDVPQLSTNSNPSITDSENSPPQTQTGPCSCLASMYLALASLQQFPSDIVSALKTVRGAAATAAQSIWCPQCGAVVLDNPNPPIEAFQNTMLLGTVLPIIANGYARLLKMIDDETDAAVAAGQTKTFRFHDYGGLCGKQQTVLEAMTCVEKEMAFNAVEMPPVQWRTTVRALLRVDIYGHEQPGFHHKGLKDLVAEMEFRQQTRHDMLDAEMAAGNLNMTYLGHGQIGDKACLGEKTRGCLEILKMAKIAIDSLVIA